MLPFFELTQTQLGKDDDLQNVLKVNRKHQKKSEDPRSHK